MRKLSPYAILAAFCAILCVAASAPLEGGGVMLIGARNAMMCGKLSAKSYVQNGLVAMWDGIENAGWGVHDANANVWKNLTGDTTYDLTVKKSWGLDSLLMDGTFNAVCNAKTSLTTITLMIAFQQDPAATNGFMSFGWTFAGGGGKRPSFAYRILTNPLLYVYSFGLYESNATYSPNYNSVAVTYGAQKICAYANSEKVLDVELTLNSGVSNNRLRLGGYGSATDGDAVSTFFQGKVFHAAIYSRALTAAEIAANYAINKERFNLS